MQVYGNYLASPESDFQQFFNQAHCITFQSLPSFDIPAFLITDSTDLLFIDRFEKILKRYSQFIVENPTSVFNHESLVLSELPEEFSEWVSDVRFPALFFLIFFQSFMAFY